MRRIYYTVYVSQMQDDNTKPPNPRKLANLPRPAPYKRVGTMPIEAVKNVTSDIIRSTDKSLVDGKTARELIYNNTNRGHELLRFFLNCVDGQVPGVSGQARVRAAEFLATHLWGKPVETTVQLQLQKRDNTPLNEFEDSQLEEFARGLLQVREEMKQEADDKRERDANVVDAEIVREDGHE